MELISSAPFNFTPSVAPKVEDSTRGLQWPKQDLIKYAVFIAFHLNLQTKHDQPTITSWSFFRKLSIFVQTKNPNQCRIHHKKMMKDHCSINSLVNHLRGSIQKFQEWYNYYESALYNLRNCFQRQKQEIQKQHTVQSNKIDSQINSKESENQQLAYGKKDQELPPTNVSYIKEDTTLYNKSAKAPRTSFNPLALEQQDDFNLNLGMFEKRPTVGEEKSSFRRAASFLSGQEMWKDCQENFTSYIGKLNVLMNSSLYDY